MAARGGLLTVTALAVSMSWYGPAGADSQGSQPMIACVDARSTYVLTSREHLARQSATWRARVAQRGRCFAVQPGAHWERIFSSGGLVLMRRTPPQAGLPPLYFRADAAAVVGHGPYPPAVLQPSAPASSTSRALAQPVRTPVQEVGDATATVRTEDLPPLPVPAAKAPAAGLAALPRRRVPVPPLPVAPVAVVPLVPGHAASTSPEPVRPAPVAPLVPGVSPAATQGYAIGFTLVMVLIAVLLAAMALLLRFLLHWSPDAEPSAFRRSGTVRRPMLPPTSSRRDRKTECDPRLPAHRPARREPVVPRVGLDPQPVAHRPAPAPVAPAMLQPAGLSPGSEPWLSEDGSDIQRQCVLLLHEAGWDARIRSRIGPRHGDVVARRNGRIMALRCLPDTAPVDEEAVEEACMAREREQADAAVIVSNAICTTGARRLAAQTGVALLRAEELPAFAG